MKGLRKVQLFVMCAIAMANLGMYELTKLDVFMYVVILLVAIITVCAEGLL